MNINTPEKADLSMLDLFRLEVEAQTTVLNNGLLALEAEPTSASILESLIRAAHSIKGAARLLDLEVAVNLADLIENCFEAAHQQVFIFDANRIDVLLNAVDFVLTISQQNEETLEGWLLEQTEKIETVKNSIIALSGEGNKESGGSLDSRAFVETRHGASLPSHQLEEVPLSGGSEEIPPTAKKEQPTANLQPSTPKKEPPTANPQQVKREIQSEIPTPPPLPIAPQNPLAEPTALGDTSMLDLFRLEVEAQAAILNEGLLALESQPQSAKVLESLMRAAHSVKGAARIVALDAAVNLAHVMEDCFVAAQNQTITLHSDQVDILLHGVDLLLTISQKQDSDLNTWLSEQSQNFEFTSQQIAAILNPDIAPPVPPVPSAPSAPPAPPAPSAPPALPTPPVSLATETRQSKADNSDRVVRVSAENLNRIMGLAGETLIESNWLQPFADSLSILKKHQLELSKTLESLQESMSVSQSSPKSQTDLQAARTKERECREILGERLNELELYARRTANLSDRLYREVIASHMRPFADGVQGFPRMIRDLARKLGKAVKLEILGKATPVDRDILKKLEAPLTHILRNSVDHGLERPEERLAVGKPVEGTLKLEAVHRGGMLSITISDDGKGINVEQLRQKVINKNLSPPEVAAQLTDQELIEFLFLPGFSTAQQVTEISGRGVGLDIARSMAQEVGGTVRASSQVGKGTSFHFQLPLTLSVVRTLLVEISGEPYAFPLARIEQIVTVEKSNIYSVENRQYFTMDNRNIGLVAASQVLELKDSPVKSDALPVVIISEQSDYYGLVVDRFIGEHDLVVRPLDPRLGKVQDISAAALMGDRTPILIVDVSDLVRSVDHLLNHGHLRRFGGEIQTVEKNAFKRILVVDDSITVREMERKLLENKGYKVDIAVNGVEGWYAVSSQEYNLVISDIDMPRMNGIELVGKIKNHPKLKSIPVIIVSYKDREEDRLKGLDAGADYYLTKASFHDNTLLQAVVDLIGEAKNSHQ